MAMKFWFGKKETEEETNGVISGDLPKPDSAAESGASAAVPEQMDAAVQTLSPAAGTSADDPEGRETRATESAVPNGTSSCEAEKSAASIPAAERAVPLKVVNSGANPLRVAVHPAGNRRTQPDGGDMAASEKPVFSLRPKGGFAGAVSEKRVSVPSETAPAKAEETGRADEKNPLVRPKADQRALYYELMDGLYDALLILDEHGHIVDCSKRVSELLGYSREDAWDLPIDKVITGMSSQMFAHLKRNLAENHHILIDARCFRQDGTSFAGEVGVSTLSLTRGNNIVFAIRNIERRKNAMDELRKCQAALEIALVPTFVCDTDGFFQIVNQALLDSFGIPDASQAKSVRFVDLLPDAARLFLKAACGEKVREKMDIPTPDRQQTFKIELSLAPVQSGTSITSVAGSIFQ